MFWTPKTDELNPCLCVITATSDLLRNGLLEKKNQKHRNLSRNIHQVKSQSGKRSCLTRRIASQPCTSLWSAHSSSTDTCRDQLHLHRQAGIYWNTASFAFLETQLKMQGEKITDSLYLLMLDVCSANKSIFHTFCFQPIQERQRLCHTSISNQFTQMTFLFQWIQKACLPNPVRLLN